MTALSPQKSQKQWTTICHKNDLVENAGVCALLPNDIQVAIFSIPSVKEQVFAIGNYDPISQANVLYRGIIGSNNGEYVAASPIYKQQFSLTSGQCLQEDVDVPTFKARIEQDNVQLYL